MSKHVWGSGADHVTEFRHDLPTRYYGDDPELIEMSNKDYEKWKVKDDAEKRQQKLDRLKRWQG